MIGMIQIAPKCRELNLEFTAHEKEVRMNSTEI